VKTGMIKFVKTGRALIVSVMSCLGGTFATAQTAPPVGIRELAPSTKNGSITLEELVARGGKQVPPEEAKRIMDAIKSSPPPPSGSTVDLIDKSPSKFVPRDAATEARIVDMLAGRLRQTLMSCWTAKPDAPPVAIKWMLNQDGTLMGVPKAIPSQYTTPQTKAAEQAAIKAVQSCAPFKLPPESYDLWREIQWSFASARPQ
jgi:hypothetical protein